MSYTVRMTAKAEQDLIEAVDYIALTFFNPQAADELLHRVEDAVGKLTFISKKYKIVDDPILAAWEIRLIVVQRYLVFYRVDEEANTVIILRFLYVKRNWMSIVQNEPMTAF